MLSPIPSAHRRPTNGDRDPAPLTAARAPHVRLHCQPPRPAAPQHRRRRRERPWQAADRFRRAFISCTSGRRLLFRLTAATAIQRRQLRWLGKLLPHSLARAPACPTSPAGWSPRCRRRNRCCTACTVSTPQSMPDGAQRTLKHTAEWSRSAHADAKRTFDGSRTTPEATCENLHLAPKLRARARGVQQADRHVVGRRAARTGSGPPGSTRSIAALRPTDAALVQKESERRRPCTIDRRRTARRSCCRSGRAREYCAAGGREGGRKGTGPKVSRAYPPRRRRRRLDRRRQFGSSLRPRAAHLCFRMQRVRVVPLGTQAGGVRTVQCRCACLCFRQAKDVVRRDTALEFVARVPVSTVELPELYAGHCHDASASRESARPQNCPVQPCAPESTRSRAHTPPSVAAQHVLLAV